MDDKCEKCFWNNNTTGSCVLDGLECIESSEFLPRLEPQDMFKALYMVIYAIGGWISFPAKSLKNFDDTMKIIPSYDSKKKVYVLTTAHQPQPEQKSVIVTPPKKIIRRSLVGRN